LSLCLTKRHAMKTWDSGWESGWVPEPVWRGWWESNPNRPTRSLVTVLTELSSMCSDTQITSVIVLSKDTVSL
jgi:hypothetical protein